jgi:phage replisome organizer, putative, N-terminal region
MTEKRYYWLKLKEDFFEEDTLSWIEEQEKGKEYCLFYLKLCLKSLKNEGILIRNVGQMLIPYDAKKLAELTKTDLDTVIVAMELFKKTGLVQVLENGEIYLTQLRTMVGSETSKAEIMRKKREKDKLKPPKDNSNDNNVTNGGNIVTQNTENCYTETETEQDIEKELDIEIEQQQHIDIKKILKNNFDNEEIESIRKFCIENNVAVDVVVEKIEIINHMKKIRNKVGALLTSIKEDWKPSKSQSNYVAVSGFNNFEAREYDYDSLEKKLLGWDND